MILSKVFNGSENSVTNWNVTGFRSKIRVQMKSVEIKLICFKSLTRWLYMPLGSYIPLSTYSKTIKK